MSNATQKEPHGQFLRGLDGIGRQWSTPKMMRRYRKNIVRWQIRKFLSGEDS